MGAMTAREKGRETMLEDLLADRTTERDAAEMHIDQLKSKIAAADDLARRLMIDAAQDQSTVRAVASALDKVRVKLMEA